MVNRSIHATGSWSFLYCIAKPEVGNELKFTSYGAIVLLAEQ